MHERGYVEGRDLTFGVPVNFKTRPLSNPTECAEAFSDILAAIGRGELTPDEGNMIGALIERRGQTSSKRSSCKTKLRN
jgi:hypothetical protein